MSQKRVSSRFSLHRFYLADGCFGSNVFRLCPPILLMRVQRAGGHGSALCFGGAFSVRPRGPLTCPGTTGAFLLRRGRSARGRHSPRPRPPRLRPARRDGGRAERSSPGSLYTIARLFLGALQVTPAGAGSPVSGKCAPSKSWDGFSLGRGPRGPSATQARAADSWARSRPRAGRAAVLLPGAARPGRGPSGSVPPRRARGRRPGMHALWVRTVGGRPQTCPRGASHGLLGGEQQRVDVLEPLELRLVDPLYDIPVGTGEGSLLCPIRPIPRPAPRRPRAAPPTTYSSSGVSCTGSLVNCVSKLSSP